MPLVVEKHTLQPGTTSLELPVDAVADSVDVESGAIILSVLLERPAFPEHAERLFSVTRFDSPISGALKALGRVFLAGIVYQVYEVQS